MTWRAILAATWRAILAATWRVILAATRRAMLAQTLLASVALALGACTMGGPATIEPPTPLSNVTPDMLNPDGTFKKNGLAPIDPSEQF